MVHSVDGMLGKEAVAEKRCLTSLLSNKLKCEYLEMCSFVRNRMSLAIARSKTLLIQGAMDKEAYIRQIIDLADGEVMALIAPWRGYGSQRLDSGRVESRVANRNKVRRERKEDVYKPDSGKEVGV